MAFTLPDFLHAPLEDTLATNFIENLSKGYKMGTEPAQLYEEQKKRVLANKLKDLDLQHKPTEYALGDKEKSLANAIQAKALEHWEEKFDLERRYKEAQINKAGRAATNIIKPNGKIANIAWVRNELKDPNIDPAYARQLEQALIDEKENVETGNQRRVKLNETQYKRDATQITKKYDELRDIRQGRFPGTQDPITPEDQGKMESTLLLSLIHDTTDAKTRDKLINANNMNITLDSIDPKSLTQYSGFINQGEKLGDALLEGFGAGSPQYTNYLHEINKATFAAKQMRQYLGDSIQPTAQKKLDDLAKPEAWNVSPETAEENFNFMKDLYKRESETLVRAMTDPTLYSSTGSKQDRAFAPPASKNSNRTYNLATKRWE